MVTCWRLTETARRDARTRRVRVRLDEGFGSECEDALARCVGKDKSA